MKWNRLLAILMTLLLCAGLIGCGETEGKPSGEASGKNSGQVSGKVSEKTSEKESGRVSEKTSDKASGSPNPIRPDGREIKMELYSEETPFEYWRSGDGKDYYQLCVVFDKADLDASKGVGSDDYTFTFRVWYRESGSGEAMKNLDTPVETVYDFGDSVIYRLQTYPMMKDLTVGRNYELTIEVEEGGNAAAWADLTVPYTQSSADALAKYEATLEEVKS